MKRRVLTTALFLCRTAFAGEAVDFGRLEIEGKLRGPELQVIESNQLGADAAGRMFRWNLTQLEKKLLKRVPPVQASRGKTK